MFNHPVLQEMLASKCCSERATGLGFALYASLCEGYRLRSVGWRYCQALDLIYVVTSSKVAVKTSPSPLVSGDSAPGPSCASKRSKDQPQSERKKFLGLESTCEDSSFLTNSKKDKQHELDFEASKCEGHECTEKENESQIHIGPSNYSGKSATTSTVEAVSREVDESIDLVCVPVVYDSFLEDSFLQQVQSLVMPMHPRAELSLVPMDHWRVLGNFSVSPGIDDSSDASLTPLSATKISKKPAEQSSENNSHPDGKQIQSEKSVSEARIAKGSLVGELLTENKSLSHEERGDTLQDTNCTVTDAKNEHIMNSKTDDDCAKMECSSAVEDAREYEDTVGEEGSASIAVKFNAGSSKDEWGATESWDDA